MELTPEQEKTVSRIMAEMGCPKGFVCREDAFENICCASVYGGADPVQCVS